MKEHFFDCIHCWQKISVLIDVSQISQNYVEDCEICCNPIQISYTTQNQEILEFKASNIGQ